MNDELLTPRVFWLEMREAAIVDALRNLFSRHPAQDKSVSAERHRIAEGFIRELQAVNAELAKIKEEAECENEAREAAKEAGRREMSIAFQTPALKQTAPKTLEEARGMVPKKRDENGTIL